jgi:hypothetical protein
MEDFDSTLIDIRYDAHQLLVALMEHVIYDSETAIASYSVYNIVDSFVDFSTVHILLRVLNEANIGWAASFVWNYSVDVDGYTWGPIVVFKRSPATE